MGEGVIDSSESATATPSESAGRRRPVDPRRAMIAWIAGALVTVLAFAATVVVLNSTVYSAGGFVTRYLQAIERRDLATLLDLPGVEVPDGSDTGGLLRAAIDPVDEAVVRTVRELGDGRFGVEVRWRDGTETGSLLLQVERTTPTAVLFDGWRFAVSPIQAVPVTVQHAAQFRVNGVEVETASTAGAAAVVPLAAFMPSSLRLDLDGRYLSASPVEVVADDDAAATVDVQATPEFVDSVQKQLDAFLDSCTEQKVLLPAGCPFGTFIEDRLAAPPTWTLAQYPVVAVEPGERIGVWVVPPTQGVARVSAEVISLFDGTRSALEEDAPFEVDYRIEIGADGSLTVADAAG